MPAIQRYASMAAATARRMASLLLQGMAGRAPAVIRDWPTLDRHIREWEPTNLRTGTPLS